MGDGSVQITKTSPSGVIGSIWQGVDVDNVSRARGPIYMHPNRSENSHPENRRRVVSETIQTNDVLLMAWRRGITESHQQMSEYMALAAIRIPSPRELE